MKRKCAFMSITMAIIVLVSLYTVCASISVGAVNSGGANVQSALVGAPVRSHRSTCCMLTAWYKQS